jgi:hypothetical protein
MNDLNIPANVEEHVRRCKEQAAEKAWIGVDLDATLAVWHGWSVSIGEPIPEMVLKVKAALAAGQKIKIFTARVCRNVQSEEQREFQVQLIKAWCLKHIGQELEVTNEKDFYMEDLWDDRARQVYPNKGVFLEDVLLASLTDDALRQRLAKALGCLN